MDNLLEVQDLTTCFPTRKGPFPAIQNISFAVSKGKSLGIVGESGSGKSVTALSIMRLTQEGNGWVESGVIKFDGDDILKYSESKMRKVRGNKISMIFQEPMTSLNPVHTIGAQIAEVMTLHRGYSKKAALDKAVEILDLVKIPNPRARISEYPFQLSGGMRQRVMIGMALACEPELLIADEPTTALDVTTQAEILDLLEDLRTKLNMSLLFISHDLGVISRVCDEVIVMYAGEVVERASVMDIFVKPSHPYTQALIECIPKLGFKGELKMIPGNIPSISERPTGCRFRNRCPYAFDKCQTEPPLFALKAGGAARCWLKEREAE